MDHENKFPKSYHLKNEEYQTINNKLCIGWDVYFGGNIMAVKTPLCKIVYKKGNRLIFQFAHHEDEITRSFIQCLVEIEQSICMNYPKKYELISFLESKNDRYSIIMDIDPQCFHAFDRFEKEISFHDINTLQYVISIIYLDKLWLCHTSQQIGLRWRVCQMRQYHFNDKNKFLQKCHIQFENIIHIQPNLLTHSLPPPPPIPPPPPPIFRTSYDIIIQKNQKKEKIINGLKKDSKFVPPDLNQIQSILGSLKKIK
jgi:hypothetical protein